MKLIIAIFFIFISNNSFGVEIATTTAGKKVILNKDGTWKEFDEKTTKTNLDSNFIIQQKSIGKSSSNASYEVLNTFTTKKQIRLCIKVSNKTTNKIAVPVFATINCSEDGQTCIKSFTGFLTDGNNNNLKAEIKSRTLDRFLGVTINQVSLYPSESVIFKITAKRPINFINDAINKIQELPEINIKEMTKNSRTYSEYYKTKVNKLICKQYKPLNW
jgi:hypothetical protein